MTTTITATMTAARTTAPATTAPAMTTTDDDDSCDVGDHDSKGSDDDDDDIVDLERGSRDAHTPLLVARRRSGTARGCSGAVGVSSLSGRWSSLTSPERMEPMAPPEPKGSPELAAPQETASLPEYVEPTRPMGSPESTAPLGSIGPPKAMEMPTRSPETIRSLVRVAGAHAGAHGQLQSSSCTLFQTLEKMLTFVPPTPCEEDAVAT